MLKPEQIKNAKFTPVSTGTYSAEEVDAFLAIVAEAYQDSLNEKTELIKKMGVLADKVESYRKDEDAIKGALLDAHRMAESLNRTSAEKAESTVNEANEKAAEIKADAEKNAAEISAAARTQAGEIVTNAKNAVESIKNRAQAEADDTTSKAKIQADKIVADANTQASYIIGNSKTDYEFYSKELEKVKAELEKFRAMVEMLCNGDIGPEIVTEEIKNAASKVVIPTIEEAPKAPEKAPEPVSVSIEEIAAVSAEIKAPEAPAEPEPVVPFATDDEDDELFDFLSSDDDEESLDSIASDIDSILPDPHFDAPAAPAAPVAPVEATPDFEVTQIPEDAPAQASEAAPAEEDEDDDDFFKEFSDELDDDSLNIPGTPAADDDDISSLFDSLFD